MKAVILDVDDTLCLTEAACFELENATLAAMGRDPMPRELHLKTWGKPLFDIMPIRSPGIDVREFRAAYEPLIKSAISEGRLDVIPPENLRAIDQLVALGKSVMLLTSREHGEFEHMLDAAHPLNGRIDAFYYKDNMEYHKPDPRAFAQIEANHGWLPEECVYVGDSVSDADAALGAGLSFVCSLESGLRTREDFARHQVDAYI
ncbi:HAD family hydrolase [Candidatus Saccharibacteria bacterium]|nr:HAD family hydrolase [Candidatus Saccharibacteria bacterium]